MYHTMKRFFLLPSLIIFLAIEQSCIHTVTSTEEGQPEELKQRAKFEPEDGKCILFVGQELTAIGGVEGFEDGYFNHFRAPGGFTMYTNFSPGDTMFGHVTKGLDGVFSTDEWGDTPSNMSLQLADEDFENSALAIGLWLVNHEGEVAKGEQDSLINKLGDFLKSLGDRPVFLRIGYEFAGEWNHYDREEFLTAYKRIKDTYDDMGIDNVAYVWQSHGWEEPMELLEAWYPGDEYVDWCAYSFFARWDEAHMIEFARKHGKPVFIAEASPTLGTETVKENGKTKEIILSKPEQAQEAWEEWFVPFFQTIEEHEDAVKAISYINAHWKAAPMWFDNPTFQDVDARLQISPMISKKWKEKVYTDRFLHASDTLFDMLWENKQ